MIVFGSFEWDVRQSAACLAAHGVSFKEASTVFASDDVAISVDPASGWLRAIGSSSRGRVLVVLHQRGARLRILGATPHTNGPVEALAPAPAAEAASPESSPPRTGWTAEAYGIYWDAYSAAREAARRQGKNHKEAQRLGREAGERAVGGRMEPAPR